jgi:hypothetical protein
MDDKITVTRGAGAALPPPRARRGAAGGGEALEAT